jgi:error-prone DNA polymerase
MYVELHARSAFSFLRGGSDPEAMARAVANVGLPGLALCDRGGVYGSVRLHMKAREAGFRAHVGCEIVMEDETVVPVLVASQAGYRRLCDLLTTAHLRAPKGEGRVQWSELATDNTGLIALTGDEEGPVRRAWERRGTKAAAEVGAKLVETFGRDRLYVEIQRHHLADEEEHNDYLVAWARDHRLPLLATNGVTHAEPSARHVLDVFTCIREHTTLAEAGRRLARNSERHVKGDAAMRRLFADLPEAIAHTDELAARLDFTLDNLGYRFPDFPVPDNHTQDTYLAEMTIFGAHQRYGSFTGAVKRQLQRELALIARLGFSGYFLIVWSICNYARQKGILVQGRGSAANSAVCYALGITAVDPIGGRLLFERFLSEGRSDWPDIDLDLPSGDAREDVIQEVYRRYGRRGAAMTANVISMRGKSTMREVGKAFGLANDVLDRFSSLFHYGDYPQTIETKKQVRSAGFGGDERQLDLLLSTCRQVYALPRHLGQHSGGMVLSAGGLSQFVPLENASMPGRSVLQWDKSDIEDMKMIKIDLLGLGMMAVLSDAVEICEQRGRPVDYARIPHDDAKCFEMAQVADTIGVFQIESRAQMATLPRMKPACFYDLAIQVALIRPGPIQGDAVNPYLERRAGKQPVTYPDERARPILERTLGVVLFQEQILRLAMELGGFTASEADELRRAIGFTRSSERLDRMKGRLRDALLRNHVTPEATESIITSLASFALYGFPESHAISFALIAYSSLWLKAHQPAVFLAALINNQPMGFYSVATLVQDAKRHGVKVLPPCVQVSDAPTRVDDDTTVRLGIASIKGVRAASVEKMLAARSAQSFASVDDFLRRTNFSAKERRALAGAGALNTLAGHRRAALWQVETQDANDELFRFAVAEENNGPPAPLEPMTLVERVRADFVHLELTTGAHPMKLIREQLNDVWPAAELKHCTPGQRVTIAGAVTCRQRPGTASGVVFVTLEDETGTANAVVWAAVFERYRLVINLEPALMITGKLQHESNVIHVIADVVEPLPALTVPVHSSHDYH